MALSKVLTTNHVQCWAGLVAVTREGISGGHVDKGLYRKKSSGKSGLGASRAVFSLRGTGRGTFKQPKGNDEMNKMLGNYNDHMLVDNITEIKWETDPYTGKQVPYAHDGVHRHQLIDGDFKDLCQHLPNNNPELIIVIAYYNDGKIDYVEYPIIAWRVSQGSMEPVTFDAFDGGSNSARLIHDKGKGIWYESHDATYTSKEALDAAMLGHYKRRATDSNAS